MNSNNTIKTINSTFGELQVKYFFGIPLILDNKCFNLCNQMGSSQIITFETIQDFKIKKEGSDFTSEQIEEDFNLHSQIFFKIGKYIFTDINSPIYQAYDLINENVIISPHNKDYDTFYLDSHRECVEEIKDYSSSFDLSQDKINLISQFLMLSVTEIRYRRGYY